MTTVKITIGVAEIELQVEDGLAVTVTGSRVEVKRAESIGIPFTPLQPYYVPVPMYPSTPVFPTITW